MQTQVRQDECRTKSSFVVSLKIKYKKGYKYQLVETYKWQVRIFPSAAIKTFYMSLHRNGYITIRKGYAWDGPSGPTIDTKNFLRGSLIHDALYQLMREGYLDQKYRNQADLELYYACRQDGMSKFRAWYVLKAVQWFAKKAASPADKKPVLVAP